MNKMMFVFNANVVIQICLYTCICARLFTLANDNVNAAVIILYEIKMMLVFLTRIQSFIQATSNVLQPNNFKAWKELQDVNRILVLTKYYIHLKSRYL